MKKHLYFIFLLFTSSHLLSQDLESTIKSISTRAQNHPIKVSGLLSFQAAHTAISGISPRYNTSQYRILSSLHLDVLGIQAPVSFIYSNGNAVYRLPSYALYGLSPSYKWAKLHIGDRSMTFSPYSLNGHMFKGMGMELKPGKFRLAAMYGRLRRAVAEDRQYLQGLDPAYKRMGMGLKMGYESDKTTLSAILFGADDRDRSFIPDTASFVRPAQNINAGIQASHRLGPVQLFMDLARNYLSRDTRAIEIAGDWKEKAFGLFTPRLSSSYTHAFNLRSSIQIKKAIWTMGFERVDPGFYSLGSLFFQNDFENITSGLQWPMLNQKLNLSLNTGWQRNYLHADESNTQNRWLLSAQASYIPNQKFSGQLSYSNFNHTTRMRSTTNPLLPVDSLRLISAQQQIAASMQYVLNEDQSSMLGLISNYSRGASIINDVIRLDKNDFYFIQAYHQYRSNSGFQMHTGINYNASSIQNISGQLSVGPSIQLQKPFYKNKLTAMMQIADSEVYRESSHTHRVFNINASLSFLTGHQNMHLRSAYIRRQALRQTSLAAFNELWIEAGCQWVLK